MGRPVTFQLRGSKFIANLSCSGYECGVGWKLPTLIVSVGCVALVVAGVAVGIAAHGPVGAMAGAVPGAVAGVLAGFVPGFRDAAKQRRDERVRAEAAWDSVGELVADQGPTGPAGLLRVDRAVVEFTGRAGDMAALRAWCCSDTPQSMRLLVGAGGVGKTRIALEIASEWEAGGGVWRLVSLGEEHRAVAAARGVTSGRVLLIVDYAEGRPELDRLLRAVVVDPGPIRVLLLARSTGEWWDRIAEAVADDTRIVGIIFERELTCAVADDTDRAAAASQYATTAAWPDSRLACGYVVDRAAWRGEVRKKWTQAWPGWASSPRASWRPDLLYSSSSVTRSAAWVRRCCSPPSRWAVSGCSAWRCGTWRSVPSTRCGQAWALLGR